MITENKPLIFNFSETKLKKISLFTVSAKVSKVLKFCDDILQAVVILDKKLKMFIFVFVNHNFSFF